jgi:hypothetical protein
MATNMIAPSTASIARSCANIGLRWVSRSWWPAVSALRATPSPWPRHTGFALSPCCRRRWACGTSWLTTPHSGSCRSCGSGRAAVKGSGRRITGPPSCAPIAGRRRPARCRGYRCAGWWWNPSHWPRPKPRGTGGHAAGPPCTYPAPHRAYRLPAHAQHGCGHAGVDRTLPSPGDHAEPAPVPRHQPPGL